MAWLGLDRLFLGVDLDEQQRLGEERDALKAQQDLDRLNRGIYSPTTYQTVRERADAAATGDVTAQVNEEFGKGLDEGISNVRGTIGSIIDAAVFTPLRLIPWQVWLGLLIVLFIYMGGWTWLQRLTKGRLAR